MIDLGGWPHSWFSQEVFSASCTDANGKVFATTDAGYSACLHGIAAGADATANSAKARAEAGQKKGLRMRTSLVSASISKSAIERSSASFWRCTHKIQAAALGFFFEG